MTNYYVYIRVSTKEQDIARQLAAMKKWKKENDLIIDESNYFIDYYSGKTFDRPEYQKLKVQIKSGDYLIVKEVDRLGRNWDLIKKEWQELKDNNINIIIIDTPILSDGLPGTAQPIEGLDLRLIKEQILSLMCYSAQKEREKISIRTKEALQALKQKGLTMGRPRSPWNTEENFINTLEMMINNHIGYLKACRKTRYPETSFANKIRELYKKYNTKDYKIILENYKKEIEKNG